MNELINSGVILTNRGKQLIEDANATGRDIQLKQFAVGDGDSDSFNPTLDELKALTAIPGQWEKRNLSSVVLQDAGGYVVEGLVPHNVGEGRWVRIFGLYTTDNELMYVFLYPEWQKPVNNGNLLIELPFRATIGISDSATFTLVIDPSLVAATQQFVLEQDRKLLDTHFITTATPLVLSKRNVFTQEQAVQLPVAPDGAWLVARKSFLHVSEKDDCRYLAPPGEKIIARAESYDFARLVDDKDHTFIRLKGVWTV